MKRFVSAVLLFSFLLSAPAHAAPFDPDFSFGIGVVRWGYNIYKFHFIGLPGGVGFGWNGHGFERQAAPDVVGGSSFRVDPQPDYRLTYGLVSPGGKKLLIAQSPVSGPPCSGCPH